VIGSVEVLEAKMAFAGTTRSQSARTACLTAIFSSTASIVMSQPSKPAYSSDPPRSAIFLAKSARVIRRFLSLSFQMRAACAYPSASASGLMSFMRVG